MAIVTICSVPWLCSYWVTITKQCLTRSDHFIGLTNLKPLEADVSPYPKSEVMWRFSLSVCTLQDFMHVPIQQAPTYFIVSPHCMCGQQTLAAEAGCGPGSSLRPIVLPPTTPLQSCHPYTLLLQAACGSSHRLIHHSILQSTYSFIYLNQLYLMQFVQITDFSNFKSIQLNHLWVLLYQWIEQ